MERARSETRPTVAAHHSLNGVTSRYSNPDLWVEACDRAFQSAAVAFLGVIGTNLIGITAVHWTRALDVAALASLISLLTSIARAKPGNHDG